MSADVESRRQLVHMAAGAFAFLLPYLSWWQAVALALGALTFNMLVLPRVAGPQIFRSWELSRVPLSGIVLYPGAVLALVLAFPARPDIAAAAWGILALGDGMATVAGHRIGGARLPWNRDKTVAGSAAFFLCGSAAGVLLAWWCRPALSAPPSLWFSLGAPVLAALAAAAAESMPIRLDDNITVPATAAGVMLACSVVSADAIRASLPEVLGHFPYAVAVNGLTAYAGHRARTVSTAGAVAGAVIGTVIYAATGWPGWLLLFATFLAAAVSSRVGLRRKTVLGIAEERGGRRGPGNAMANTGVAFIAAVLAVATGFREWAIVGFAAALAAGGSDTVASEIGKAFGRHAYLVSTLRGVPAGTPGAVSVEGTAAGLLAAFGLAALAAGLALVPVAAVIPIVAGATVGAFAESLLGATLEPAGIVNNDVLNFLNTGIAALVAVLLAAGAA